MKNPYLVLELGEDADQAAIDGAYRRLLRQYPPETHPERFQLVAEAYAALRDEEKRAEIAIFGCLKAGDKPADLLPPSARPKRLRAGMAAWQSALAEVARA